eukprot:9470330-Pyramimonas_sp.AAC.1
MDSHSWSFLTTWSRSSGDVGRRKVNWLVRDAPQSRGHPGTRKRKSRNSSSRRPDRQLKQKARTRHSPVGIARANRRPGAAP